jgi:hypothetical protein
MSWLVWRQYRMTAVITSALLAAFAVLVVITGLKMAQQWHAIVAPCLAAPGSCRSGTQYNVVLGGGPLGFIIEFTLAVPAVLGMFLGAPLVARELETGTSSFIWTQGVTRRRWLAVKIGWLLLAALAWGGAVAALVTWWSGPKNAAYLNAFNPGDFDVQGIVPAAYSLFAMALGIAAGMLIRRVLPAVGVTLAGYFAVRLAIMGWIRQYYMTPVKVTLGLLDNNFIPPGAAWQYSQNIVSPTGVLPPPAGGGQGIVGNGFPVSDIPAACHRLYESAGGQGSPKLFSCLSRLGYRQVVTYQPASRYWAFQGIEAGIFVALAAALIAVTFFVVSRRDA